MVIENPTNLRKWSSAIIALIIVGFAVLMMNTTKSVTIASEDELTEIEGNLVWIRAVKTRGSISYDMQLSEYRNEFKIAADYAEIFDYTRIERDNIGSLKLKVLIRKSEVSNLNTDEKVKVFGIKKTGKPYLAVKDVLNKDSNSRKSSPYFFGFMVILAIGIYVCRRYYHEHDI